MLNQIHFPEFSSNISIDSHSTYLFEQNCQYNLIFGANWLDKFGFIIIYDDHIITWMDHNPLKETHEFFGPNMFSNLYYEVFQQNEDSMSDWNILNNNSAWILDARYEQVDINKVAVNQKHLTQIQCLDLQNVLAKYEKLFDGSHGVYLHKVHIDLIPGSEPVHHRVYPVLYVHEQSFKKELQYMFDIGINKECGASEWAWTCFFIPKEDSYVRQITDLWSMQKYQLPLTHDIMHNV